MSPHVSPLSKSYYGINFIKLRNQQVIITSEIWSPHSSTLPLLNAGTDWPEVEDPFPSSTISRRGVARLRILSAAYDVIANSASQMFSSRLAVLITCMTKRKTVNSMY